MDKPNHRFDRRQFLGAVAGLSTLPLIGEAQAQTTPTQGGHLRLGMSGGSTTDSLNPTTYLQWVPVNLGYQLMNGLVEIDANNHATPELLTS
jgi:peptide/nickel transport system substrate-binding protein